jgi:hypothetical protein
MPWRAPMSSKGHERANSACPNCERNLRIAHGMRTSRGPRAPFRRQGDRSRVGLSEAKEGRR